MFCKFLFTEYGLCFSISVYIYVSYMNFLVFFYCLTNCVNFILINNYTQLLNISIL